MEGKQLRYKPSKMSCHLYHVVDCSKSYGQIFYPSPSFPQQIRPKIGHHANPGVVCLLNGSIKDLTVSPNGGMVLS